MLNGSWLTGARLSALTRLLYEISRSRSVGCIFPCSCNFIVGERVAPTDAVSVSLSHPSYALPRVVERGACLLPMPEREREARQFFPIFLSLRSVAPCAKAACGRQEEFFAP